VNAAYLLDQIWPVPENDCNEDQKGRSLDGYHLSGEGGLYPGGGKSKFPGDGTSARRAVRSKETHDLNAMSGLFGHQQKVFLNSEFSTPGAKIVSILSIVSDRP
jgi:hypothetical protein